MLLIVHTTGKKSAHRRCLMRYDDYLKPPGSRVMLVIHFGQCSTAVLISLSDVFRTHYTPTEPLSNGTKSIATPRQLHLKQVMSRGTLFLGL